MEGIRLLTQARVAIRDETDCESSKEGKVKKSFALTVVGYIIVALLNVIYFWPVLSSSMMLGDFGDGRFCCLATEHWMLVLSGTLAPLDSGMFYPVDDTMAYSDLFLGFLPFYVPLRFMGFDMFVSFKITLFAVQLVGSLAMFYLMNRKLCCGVLSSIVASIIFTFCCGINMDLHPQLFALYFVPFIAIGLLVAMEKTSDTRRVICATALSILAIDAVFYTSGYMGYYLILFGMFFVGLLAIFGVATKPYNFDYAIPGGVRYVVVYLLATIVTLVPFLVVYLPVSQHYGERVWTDIAAYLPTVLGLVNVSENNLLYTPFLSVGKSLGNSAELQMGIPPITLLVFVLSLIWIFRNRCLRGGRFLLGCAAGFAALLCMILLVKVGDHSLWYFVYSLIPGIGTMRAVGRFMLFLSFPVAICVGLFLDSALKYSRSTGHAAVFTLLVVLSVYMTLEHVWVGGPFAVWNSADDAALIEGAGDMPQNCEVIYIAEGGEWDTTVGTTPPQLDAWVLATHFGVHTLNGYSSYYPDDWSVEVGPLAPNYQECVDDWIQKYQLDNVYEYDRDMGTWMRIS
ncbi:YfhO family protein [Adlercreutzia sp. ZJ141]|uniref:YfhO family protein n=1 Tax=Adlercreutzia sp. ZJ141 TaxID=2709406 RepID=UPI0013EDDB01|nr:YfhO family protein [Adlercreutzia sp. ZJ141]